MNFEILPNGQVMVSEEIDTGTQIVVQQKPYLGGRMEKRIVITCPKTTIAINEVLSINLSWIMFDVDAGDYKTDATENRPITVKITGSGSPAELTLNPVNGQVAFDFESPIPGTFTIQATADFPCDAGFMEVTVQ